MSLARTISLALLVGILSAGIAALGHELFYFRGLRSLLSGDAHLMETSADAVERDVRSSLPRGASRNTVETVLRSRRMDYNFPSANEIDAMAPNLKSGNPPVDTALSLRFHFDAHDQLTAIDSRVVHTGP